MAPYYEVTVAAVLVVSLGFGPGPSFTRRLREVDLRLWLVDGLLHGALKDALPGTAVLLVGQEGPDCRPAGCSASTVPVWTQWAPAAAAVSACIHRDWAQRNRPKPVLSPLCVVCMYVFACLGVSEVPCCTVCVHAARSQCAPPFTRCSSLLSLTGVTMHSTEETQETTHHETRPVTETHQWLCSVLRHTCECTVLFVISLPVTS